LLGLLVSNMINLIMNHTGILFGQKDLPLLAEIVGALVGFRKAMFTAETCLTFPAFEVGEEQLLLTAGGSAALLGFRWFCCCCFCE
jgi:hypothetical protein